MKKLLSTFTIGCIGLISFCSAGQVVDILDLTTINQTTLSNGVWTDLVDFGSDRDSYTVCFNYDGYAGELQTGIGTYSSTEPGTNFTYWHDWNGKYVCFYKSPNDRYLIAKSDRNTLVYGDYFILNELLDYDIDTNYCVSNNLCPVPENSWSALYINDIQHESAGTINIIIPEEFSWDYTGDEEEFNLNVIGYNVDTDYIEGIITNQTTKPNQTDLNNIITGVLPLFVPGLVIILFIYFIFKFLKKIF